MKNIENIWFKIGFGLTTLAVVGLNLYTYIVNRNEFLTRRFHFDHDGFWWGFPVKMYYIGTCFPCRNPLDPFGFFINFVSWAVVAALVGILFESLANRFSNEENLTLK